MSAELQTRWERVFGNRRKARLDCFFSSSPRTHYTSFGDNAIFMLVNPQTSTAAVIGRPWSNHEDRLLTEAVAIHGSDTEKWKTIALAVPGRTNKACRKVMCTFMSFSCQRFSDLHRGLYTFFSTILTAITHFYAFLPDHFV